MFDSDAPLEASQILDRFVDNLPGLAYRCDPAPPWGMTFLRGQVEPLTGYTSRAFEAEGGFTERLHRVRTERRKRT